MFDDDRIEIHRISGAAGDYRIAIAIPSGKAPPAGWPALFIVDAEDSFATARDALRRMSRRPDATAVSPMVIVGVSTSGAGDGAARRRHDCTTPSASQPTGTTGGACAFLALIETAIIPLVAGRACIDPRALTLFGHSLAGYFALWAMCARPTLFRAYAGISPSLWWDRAGLWSAVEAADLRDRRVLILIGEWEGDLPPWQASSPDADSARARRTARDMIGTARDFGAHLAGLMGADRACFTLLPEEDHASIISAAMPRALRLASLD